MSTVTIILFSMMLGVLIIPYLYIVGSEITYKVKSSKMKRWFKRQIRYYKNHSFKKKFVYNRASKPTIAARRLIKGYFKYRFEVDFYNPFHYIISVGAEVRRNELIINVVTERPGLFMGQGGNTYSAIEAYILNSHYYTHNKFLKLNLRLEESNYWPETFEDMFERETYSDYDELVSSYH
jgi:hypothetical protein